MINRAAYYALWPIYAVSGCVFFVVTACREWLDERHAQD